MAQPATTAGGEPLEETLFTLDNIPLDLPIAGAGSRALSGFLDYLILTGLLVLWVLAIAFLVGWAGLGQGPRWRGGWAIAIFFIGFFLLEYGYFAGVEVVTGGRSFGKWAVGLKVVTRRGGRPGLAALLLRNAVRTPDLFVGVPLMLLDPLARRLGDRLAGTLVVHAGGGESELVLRRVPRGWGARELVLLEGFLRRAKDLEPWRARKMARQLLACIERDDPGLVAGVTDADPVLALRRVLEVEGL